MKNLILLVLIAFAINGCTKEDNNSEPVALKFNTNIAYGQMTDIDGNIYKTITIGSQTWMAENLRTTKFRNGVSIQTITGNINWINTSTPAMCWYGNKSENKFIYGALYNGFAVDSLICPEGWHIPSDDEWQVLFDYVGNDSGKLREVGLHWLINNSSNSNETGFTAVPSGLREPFTGGFSEMGYITEWWSSTKLENNIYYKTRFMDDTNNDTKNTESVLFGLPIRLIKN